LSIAAADAVLATGMGDAFEVAMRDSTGALRRIVRVMEPDRPLTAADIDRYRAFVFAEFRGNPTERRQMADDLDGSKLPGTLPAFAELAIDRTGNLWVRRYDHFDAVQFFNDAPVPGTREWRTKVLPDEPRTWTVLDPEGRLLGDVQTPAGFIVHEIGDDWMIGVWRDALDVEYIRLYAIIKPGR
jgi:hypothetical protein